jgi:hypothetical protein
MVVGRGASEPSATIPQAAIDTDNDSESSTPTSSRGPGSPPDPLVQVTVVSLSDCGMGRL